MSELRFFDLSIPAPRRLAMMRAAFARHPIDYPHCPEYAKPTDWRKVRAWGLHSYAAAFGLSSIGANGSRSVLTSFDADSLPVRTVRFADDVCSSIRYAEWFVDDDESQGVIRGIVASLPHGQFLSGYHGSDNGEYVIFTDQTYSDENEAARCADVEASHYAESEQENDVRFRAMHAAETLCEARESDIRDEWENYRAAWSDRHVSIYAFTAAIKLRNRVRELVRELRADRRELESAREAYERG